ncbi:glycoside hydrolase family 13 protein [Clavibacter michiganensis]|uniref:Oligo-1,6-glucosidase n=1 Tax=Clavibacter michiganensis TaxID=28447 RepID=A0A251YNY1_9MICO|nr:glycoside hydrolase family 13 protein [Clavibacter michiganensis]OUE25942.1 Oligo-1,6-glucosidase [Clavibacter michiganensis]
MAAVPSPRSEPASASGAATADAWWRSAAIYQVFLRSFADGDGDGVGDLAGLRARLPYLAALGVDAIWVNPWYPSPMVDVGYDVSDYRDVDPMFGTLADAEALIAEAHDLGLRVLLDIVPNHTSDAHPWFRAALAGDPAARARYLFREGKGADGELPPNDWESCFRGPAWTRTTDADGRLGDWYLHMFAPEQPDLDWTEPEVHAEFVDVLRFWFDRGIDGFRVDVAHGLAKAPGLPDGLGADRRTEAHPGWDQDEVHDVYREWRRVADSYDPPRVFVAEAWVARPERLPLYLRPDELHTAFEFEPLHVTFRADPWRRVIDDGLAKAALSGAPSAWALTNHDVVRQVTRYGREQPELRASNEQQRARFGVDPVDLDLGRRRARAAVTLTMALPGVAYLYFGEELGLHEVEDLPDARRRDPIHHRSGGTDPGRDGSRVPLPWSGDAAPFGFSAGVPDGGAEPWLPQPTSWAELTVERQERDPASTLQHHRRLLAARRALLVPTEPLVWLEAPPDVLAFRRGAVQCWIAFGTDPVPLPTGFRVVVSSTGDVARMLPPDTAVWLVPDRS